MASIGAGSDVEKEKPSRCHADAFSVRIDHRPRGGFLTQRTDPSLDAIALDSCTRARDLINEAESLRTRHERATRRRFTRLFRDPSALDVTIVLTDEVMRCGHGVAAVRILRRASRRASVIGFGVVNALGLRLLAAASHVFPAAVINVVHRRVRSLSSDLILDASPSSLARHVVQRERAGLHLNVNVLGEAVLGELEAGKRLERVREMMARPDVSYVSVKLSSLVSQITTIDHEGSLRRVSDQLRVLYRTAGRHGVFVNLDMEEFRDLRLTLDAFRLVLSEAEFTATSAGIVLQAYLPDSHQALDDLVAWATLRHERHGATIKIRLVKGANLAMERAEAEVHGWTPAPYATKAEVDASYARLLDVALRPEHAAAVRVGVASHNLFDVTWALDVARARGVQNQVDVEMLEGMAPSEAAALVRAGHTVLLYAPVTRHDDFAAAVAYLVRRLDENTSEENYLRAAFVIARDPKVFAQQRQRFLDSIRQRHDVATAPRRHAPAPSDGVVTFSNVADGDPTDPQYVLAVTRALAAVQRARDVVLGAHGAEEPASTGEWLEGHDPSDAGTSWYRYRVATTDDVDRALVRASNAVTAWNARPGEERRAIFERAANVMEQQRAETIAVMARDGGKTVGEADPEVSEAIDFVRYYGAQTLDGETQPLGVVLVVPPWNFPFAIPAGGVAAALAAGNAVVLKPAPETVATAWQLVRQLWEGGVPREVLQFLPTRDDECGRYLVTHDAIAGVVLTGSFETAQLFTSWKPALNLLAETSGKNAIVVTASSDVDLAVRDIVQSAFGHAGQKCSAASLVIIDQSTYDHPTFLAQLHDAVTSLCVGPAYELSSAMGPLIRHADAPLLRALGQLDVGESWLVEPRALDEAGLLWRPGVKVGVAPGSWSHRHEWFGPVLGIMTAPDVSTAIEWQNQVDFGLTAGLHSLDEEECRQWLERVQAGTLYVNRGITGAVVARQPFGGWRRSSVGPTAKAGGPNYVNCLRQWPRVHDIESATFDLRHWWDEFGSRARDVSGLEVERNLHRYRHFARPVLVRVDESVDALTISYLRTIATVMGVTIEVSADVGAGDLAGGRVETIEELVQRAAAFAKIRWLSNEFAPADKFLNVGLSVDRRPLAQSGSIEAPRWLLEQSVTITNHRYGNVHAGPKPPCPGLEAGAVGAVHAHSPGPTGQMERRGGSALQRWRA